MIEHAILEYGILTDDVIDLIESIKMLAYLLRVYNDYTFVEYPGISIRDHGAVVWAFECMLCRRDAYEIMGA